MRLRADVTAFIAAMRAAERATQRFGDEAERAARRAGGSFEAERQGSERLERQLRRQMETQEDQAEETRQQSQETRRNTEETRRNTEETRRNTEETRRQTRSREQARDELGRFTRGTDENTRSQERNNRTRDRSVRGLTAERSTLVSLIAAAVGAGTAVVSATAAMGAFGAVAAPSIFRVVAAQEDLAESWQSLSRLERESATLVNTLVDEYKELAQSYQPEALGAFNSVLFTARGLLPQIGDLVGATAGDLQTFINRINTFISDRIGGEFLTWAGQRAPEALSVLGDTLTTAGDTTLDLVEDLEPLGIGLLQLTNGTLGALNAVANINPMLAQFAVSALLLRAPLMGIANGARNTAQRVRGFAAANAGASRSTKLLHGLMAAGPALYIAAGAGLALFAIHVANSKTEVDKLIEGLRIQHRAVGNNLDGYRSLRTELETRYKRSIQEVEQAQQRSNKTVQSSKEGTDGARQSVEQLKDEQKRLREEIEATTGKIVTVQRAAQILANRYGVSADEARRMATAAGVDLSTALDGQGKITNKAAQRLDQYRQAAELANNPTKAIALSLEDAANEALTLSDRVKALTAAFDAQFTPTIQAYQATTALKEGFRQLGEQVAKAKGRMDGGSAASLQLRNAFASQLTTLQKLHQSTFQLTGSQEKANQAVNRHLPLLYALAGRNREARQQVDALARVTGFNITQTNISREAFVRQARALFGSKVNADALWQAYQRLSNATATSSSTTATYIQRVRDAANQDRIKAMRTDTSAGAQRVYNQRVRDALPVLYALAGRNKEARAQVDALARATGNATGATRTSRKAFLDTAESMGIARTRAEALWKELNKIKDRKANVSVFATGSWKSASWAQTGGPAHLVPRAHGGPIPAIGPESSRAYDSVPALLRVDEHVWTPEEVDAVGGHAAMYRMRALARRGQLRGFATGGRVSMSRSGSTRAVVDDVMKPINVGYNAMMTAMMRHMAEQWRKFVASGGPVVAAARTQIGVPYVWGGTAWGKGLDCSGLTSQSWLRGGRRWIGRTTYDQYPASRPIGTPRPGALGFPHMGHVVLATGRGTIIEAPYTGARVRETGIHRSYQWRWPKAAGFAEGGPVTEMIKRIGRRFLATHDRRLIEDAKTFGIAGDPGGLGIPGYSSGGWVRGRPGEDRNVIAATRGEFVVNKAAAAEHAALVQAINSGRVGSAFVAPKLGPSPVRAIGGDGASVTGDVHIHVHNHGVIGSRLETRDWLVSAAEDLERQGRAPWRKPAR